MEYVEMCNGHFTRQTSLHKIAACIQYKPVASQVARYIASAKPFSAHAVVRVIKI